MNTIDNPNSNSKALKAGIWYTAVNFITKGAVYFTTPFFTRLMTQEAVGAYSNVTSWFQILVALVTFDIACSINIARFDYKDELNDYIASSLLYGTVITAIFYLVICLNMNLFCEVFKMRPYAVHTIFIYMMVYPAIQMYQGWNMVCYRYKASAAISLVSLIISTGTALILTIKMEDTLWGRTIGNYVPLILLSSIIYIYLLRQSKRVSLKYLKYAVSISFPMIWHALAGQVLNAGDRVVITHVLGEAVNGLYAIAYTCSMVAYVLWTSMNSAWSPWSAEQMDSGNTEKLRKVSKPYILFYLVAVFMMLLVAPELLWIMGGKKYIEAKYVLPPVMAGCVFQFVYSLYINAEFYLKKQTRIAIGTLIAATLNLGLNLIFVPRYGYVAAAYTTMVGYFVLFLFHFISLRILGKAGWYDTKFNWLVVVLTAATVPVFNYLYKNNTLRYITFASTVVVACIVLYIYRVLIMEFLSKNILKKKNV